jgi:hypothetical protein
MTYCNNCGADALALKRWCGNELADMHVICQINDRDVAAGDPVASFDSCGASAHDWAKLSA